MLYMAVYIVYYPQSFQGFFFFFFFFADDYLSIDFSPPNK